MDTSSTSSSTSFVPAFDEKTLARFNWVNAVDSAPEEKREWAMKVYELLLVQHGEIARIARRDPMHELISTMLSHRTTGANEDLAYKRMIERFGSWDKIRDAHTARSCGGDCALKLRRGQGSQHPEGAEADTRRLSRRQSGFSARLPSARITGVAHVSARRWREDGDADVALLLWASCDSSRHPSAPGVRARGADWA
jgi:hypothetical protein